MYREMIPQEMKYVRIDHYKHDMSVGATSVAGLWIKTAAEASLKTAL